MVNKHGGASAPPFDWMDVMNERRDIGNERQYLGRLMEGERPSRPGRETPREVRERVEKTGVVHEVDEAGYNALRPHRAQGGPITVRQMGGTIRLLWRHADNYFCRQLDEEETMGLIRARPDLDFDSEEF